MLRIRSVKTAYSVGAPRNCSSNAMASPIQASELQ